MNPIVIVGAGWKIPPCETTDSIPDNQPCQETSALTTATFYASCGMPAVAIIRHTRDQRNYYMCAMCADHSLKNRGAELVFALEGEL